jgi:hypothetical protein
MVERANKRRQNGDTSTAATQAETLEELIRQRAYQLYLERGNRVGDALDDWLRAEREACGR